MNPLLRKRRTEGLLQKEGIPFLDWLPFLESEEETRIRTTEEIGTRIMCLFCVAGTAFHPDDSIFTEYLNEHDLWKYLSPIERSFLIETSPSQHRVAQFTWRSEATVLLMWAAKLFDTLPLPRQETQTNEIVDRLPPVDESPWPFIRGLQVREKSEILDQSDLIFRLHWATRQAGLENNQAPSGLNPGVIQEWHHAINWLRCYDNAEWDMVGTDT